VAIWEKFNARERLSVIGAAVIILGYIVAAVTSFGIGSNAIALLMAIVVLIVLYLKVAPNMQIAWPVAPSLIVLGASGLSALFVLIGLLSWIGLLGAYGAATIALILTVVGAGVMLWGAWQEYQVDKPALPGFMTGAGTSAAPPPAGTTPAPPPVAAPPPPPVTPPADDFDERPPA
jgi:hypothetical protein